MATTQPVPVIHTCPTGHARQLPSDHWPCWQRLDANTTIDRLTGLKPAASATPKSRGGGGAADTSTALPPAAASMLGVSAVSVGLVAQAGSASPTATAVTAINTAQPHRAKRLRRPMRTPLGVACREQRHPQYTKTKKLSRPNSHDCLPGPSQAADRHPLSRGQLGRGRGLLALAGSSSTR